MSLLNKSLLISIVIALGFNLTIIPGFLYVSNVITVILILMIFMNLKVSDLFKEQKNFTLLAFLILIVLINLNSFEGLKWIYLFITFYVFSLYFKYNKFNINYILGSYVTGIIIGTISSFQFVDPSLLGFNVLSNDYRASIDALGGFNTYGVLVAIAIIIIIHFQNIFKDSYLKTLLLLPILFLLFAEISTLSRGGFFTLASGLFFYNYFNNSIYRYINYIIAVIIISYLLSYSFDMRDLFDRYTFYGDSTGSGRTELWSYVLSLMNNPINIMFGYGAGVLNIDTSIMTGTSGAIYFESAHNTYLEILYQFGIVGLGAFILFLKNSLSAINNLEFDNKIILKTIFYSLLINMFFDSYFFSLQVAGIFSLFYSMFNFGYTNVKSL